MKYFNHNIIGTALVMSVLFTACSGKDNKTETEKAAPVTVTVASPAGSAAGGISASGQVEAVETANISTRIMGFITKLNVKVGDHVSAGQVLATINSADIDAKAAQTNAMIAEAEANVNSAQKDLNRFTALYNQQSASAKELDNVTLQYNSAKARLEAAKQMRNEVGAQRNYTTLTAPFSGTVVQKNAEAGTMASPGMPILVLERNGSYQVSAAIPETEISKVALNDKVTVAIKSTGLSFTGLVKQINPSSQFSGGQYIIKISVPEDAKHSLYAGMYVNVVVEGKVASAVTNSSAILVPLAAVISKDQLKGLYTVSANNTALLRWVRLGKTYGNEVEVISGLDKTEQFILSAEGKLYNGAPVVLKK